jgi:hypothetical protein
LYCSNSTKKVSNIDLNVAIVFSLENYAKRENTILPLCAQERAMMPLVVNLNTVNIEEKHQTLEINQIIHTINNTKIFRRTFEVG